MDDRTWASVIELTIRIVGEKVVSEKTRLVWHLADWTTWDRHADDAPFMTRSACGILPGRAGWEEAQDDERDRLGSVCSACRKIDECRLMPGPGDRRC